MLAPQTGWRWWSHATVSFTKTAARTGTAGVRSAKRGCCGQQRSKLACLRELARVEILPHPGFRLVLPVSAPHAQAAQHDSMSTTVDEHCRSVPYQPEAALRRLMKHGPEGLDRDCR